MAVVLVMMRHFDFTSIAHTGNYLYKGIQELQKIGWIGVDLFFVISGFLIGGLIFAELDKTQKFDIKRFFIRRAFKIYPSFYLLIVLTAIIFYFKKELNYKDLYAELFYFQNYHNGLWSHTWSLAVEEHFYILLPLLFYGFRPFSMRHNSKKVFIFLIGLIIIINLLKYSQRMDLLSENRVTFYSHLRIDGLLFGVLLCYLYRYANKWIIWWSKYLSLPMFVLGLPIIYKIGIEGIFSPSQFEYGYTLLYVYFGNLLLLLIYAERMLRNRFFYLPIKLGLYSYSIYLWHMPCKFWILGRANKYIDLDYFLQLALYVISSFVVGIIFAKMVEMPFLKIRDRLFPGISK